MATLSSKLQTRYGYGMTVLRGLVKTDFKLRYQGSFLGMAWSVLKPLMLFAVMYVVFGKFLRMSDGTPTYPVVLLMGITSWQMVTETVNIGLRAIVDRGDLLRKVHFPNYIVVVSASIGSMISFGINFVVVLIFAFFSHVHFTWEVLWVPLNVLQLYILALALALLFSTMYVYFRDIAHIWEVLQQIIFYGMPIIYPLSYVIDRGGIYAQLAKLELLNPIAQAIQDIRHNLLAPQTQPTIWNTYHAWWVKAIPLTLTVVLICLGVFVFRKNSRKFAEVM
ncbi:ABC transporter permease [Bifidobacterium gallicum]|uniref:Transport permease protein n=1 Tax=Bifidobacterium gallicum DSM 20093 = LMG 11596 TaxID=561180 RepID=D1NVS6_9BIFI|nr:ABC transporter permease [Bifidobacterium gallicum]EFA22927.1 ABC-2 type transporter [Bifidobacterium gallicum DSM 20093 = LMG 11596]KFI59377.1 glycosyl transferase family 9 [Bifidobacterium gallicum DSM 20093 = LMG 11596]